MVVDGGMRRPWMNRGGFGGFFRERENVIRVDFLVGIQDLISSPICTLTSINICTLEIAK